MTKYSDARESSKSYKMRPSLDEYKQFQGHQKGGGKAREVTQRRPDVHHSPVCRTLFKFWQKLHLNGQMKTIKSV